MVAFFIEIDYSHETENSCSNHFSYTLFNYLIKISGAGLIVMIKS